MKLSRVPSIAQPLDRAAIALAHLQVRRHFVRCRHYIRRDEHGIGRFWRLGFGKATPTPAAPVTMS